MFKRIRFALLIVSLLFIVTSCSTIKELKAVNGGVFLSGWDFREYQEKGFLFTPEKYSYEYESVGVLELEVIPHAFYDYTTNYTKKVDKNLARQRIFQVEIDDKLYRIRTKNMYTKDKVWFVETIEPKTVVKRIYDQAIEMGANALMNFKVIKEGNPYYPGYVNTVYLTSYTVSGLAIRRTPK